MTAAELSIRPILNSEEELSLVQRCLHTNQDVRRSPERIRWQYLHNPDGRLYIDVAVDPDADAVAAMYAVFPVAMKIGSEQVVGTQSLDTLTDKRYRGRGLFITLARSVYGRLQRDGIACVYGFPNGSSAPGFFSKLGWQSLDPVPFLVRPLRTRYFLSRVPRLGKWLAKLPNFRLPVRRVRKVADGAHIRPCSTFGADFDHLWSAVATELPVAVVRDSRYLAWRFASRPESNYQTLGAYGDTGLQGFVTYCVREKHGGRIGYIMELLVHPSARHHGTDLLNAALADIQDSSADAVLAWNMPHSPTAPQFRQARFISMPERLRPIELHFGVASFAPKYAQLLGSRDSWYVSYADSDTV